MPHGFPLFLLYLFYGLAFFSLGAAISSRDIRFSQLALARHLWLLAAFAYLHALHEWCELFFQLQPPTLPPDLLPLVQIGRRVLGLASFLCLLAFGFRLLGETRPRWRRPLLGLIGLLTLALLLTTLYNEQPLTPAGFGLTDLHIRLLFGLPAAALTGLGFLLYARTLRARNPRGARAFIGTGLLLLAYGILTGLIPSGTVLPPGIRVELLRGLSAFCILYFMMHGLQIFDTERHRQLEERLQRFAQAEKLHALGRIAAGIAHEVNNPLTNVKLNLDLLRQDIEQARPQDSWFGRLDAIARNADRAARIARDLLSISAGREAPFVPVNLNEVVERTLALVGPQQQEFDLRRRLQPELPTITGNPWKLEGVLLNLLLNAMDASSPGGLIEIVTRRDDAVLLQVIDHGSGIPEADQSHLFEPFFTTKAIGRGTGLGLAVSYAIVEQQGGRITIDSREGCGTCVTLSFPAGG